MNQDFFKFISTDDKLNVKRGVLGNGYFGIDVSNNFGQGYGVSEYGDLFPVTYLAGTFSLDIGRTNKDVPHSLFRAMSQHTLIPADQDINDVYGGKLENFTQELDMKKGLVTTQGVWNGSDTVTHIFLSRRNPHIGALQFCISSVNLKTPTEFQQYIRKDPRTKFQGIEFEQKENFNVFTTIIEENGFKFKGKDSFKVIQISWIEIKGNDGRIIPFKQEMTIENDGELDFDDELTYINKISIQEKVNESITITLFFSIFKDYDVSNIDKTLLEYALSDVESIKNLNFNQLLEESIQTRDEEIWSRLIEVDDEKLQRRIISSMYYLTNTFKAGYNYSSGPTGINGHAWQGYTFWDSDLWMNLGLLLWAPELSRCITEYRFNHMEGAKQHRINYIEEYEYEGITDGIKFPWQSATSGLEAAPPRWSAQEHITCDVIYGQYLYVLTTNDEDYLKNIAYPLSYQACIYLGQRVQKEDDGKYHFRGIIPADEFPFPYLVDDNAFTNLYVKKCLEIIINWAKQLNKEIPNHWIEITENMFYNFNEEEQRVIEFTNYKGQKIKQADTNLLTFPLEYPFSEEIKRNNMLYYFDKLPENKIMMGSAVFSTIACELKMVNKAWDYFQDLYPHFHEEQFFIPSEAPTNHCWPFLTGLGGFLFNIINGFGGIRLRDRGNNNGILFDPILPKEIPKIIFRQLEFQGIKYEYSISNTDGNISFRLRNHSETKNLNLYFRNSNVYIPENISVEIIEADQSEVFYSLSLEKEKFYTFKKQA